MSSDSTDSTDKADPQIQPDAPPRAEQESSGRERGGQDAAPEIEDPDLRSGQYGPGSEQH